MTAAKYVDPNYNTQTGTAYPLGLDGDVKVLSRLGAAYNPCAEDTPSALKVVVQAGAMFANGALVANAAQMVTLSTADATNPRIDRVVLDMVTGVASKVDGIAAGSPTPPAIPDGKLPVAQVLVTAGMTVVTNSAIADERVGTGPGNSLFQMALAERTWAAPQSIPLGTSYTNGVFNNNPILESGYSYSTAGITVQNTGRYLIKVKASFTTTVLGSFKVAATGNILSGKNPEHGIKTESPLNFNVVLQAEETVDIAAGTLKGIGLSQAETGSARNADFYLSLTRLK